MAESKLRELSMEFSVDIINIVKFLSIFIIIYFPKNQLTKNSKTIVFLTSALFLFYNFQGKKGKAKERKGKKARKKAKNAEFGKILHF